MSIWRKQIFMFWFCGVNRTAAVWVQSMKSSTSFCQLAGVCKSAERISAHYYCSCSGALRRKSMHRDGGQYSTVYNSAVQVNSAQKTALSQMLKLAAALEVHMM